MAEQQGEDKFRLRELSPDDNVSGLFLREPEVAPLAMFLKRSAKAYHTGHVAKTYVAVTETSRKVRGFITLVCSQCSLTNPPEGLDGFKHDYPAVKIAQLAVDQRLQKSGLGRKLVHLAVATVVDKIMPTVGCRLLIVDAHHTAVPFYRDKCGFTLLDTPANLAAHTPLLFLDLGRVAL